MQTNMDFGFYMPVNILFGEGRIGEIGRLVAVYGKRALLVATPWADAQSAYIHRIISLMEREGISVAVYDKVCPNPTVAAVDEGAAFAREHRADVVVGVGGGSSLDASKAIAVGATHPGSIWDYSFTAPKQPDNRALPTVAVGTTAGTGAHITHGAVITHTPTFHKSAIVGKPVIPKACIVDPELTYTMPAHLSAITGFDAFTHAFECFIHKSNNRLVDGLALEAVRIIVENLPRTVENGEDAHARRMMAYADTLAGICNANVGTTLPHAMGSAIGGRFPHVAHGEALAAVYPGILDFSWQCCAARFAQVARIYDGSLADAPDDEAAQSLGCLVRLFLDRIGLCAPLPPLCVGERELDALTEAAMWYPDAYANPAVPTPEQVRAMYQAVLAWAC